MSHSFDNLPCVSASKPVKSGSPRRLSKRPPLQERSPLSNNINFNTAKPSAFLDQLQEAANAISTSKSFHPLPPVLASPLELPSFFDFSVRTFSPSGSPTEQQQGIVPPSPPIVEELFSVPGESSPPKSNLVPLPTQSEELFGPVAFSHPNSPYVPWSLPMRREIMRPQTPASMLSSRYSRPYSRSGARAPEPASFIEEPYQNSSFRKVSRTLKSLGQSMKRKISRTTHRFSFTKKSKIGKLPPIVVPTDEQDTFDSFPLPSPTVASCESSHTTTLAAWLESRQLADVAAEADRSRCMTINEYELRGSWVNLPSQNDKEADRELFYQPPPQDHHHSATHLGKDYLTSATVTQERVPETLPFPRDSRSEWPDMFADARQFHQGTTGDLHPHCKPFGTRARELSMPGGWED